MPDKNRSCKVKTSHSTEWWETWSSLFHGCEIFHEIGIVPENLIFREKRKNTFVLHLVSSISSLITTSVQRFDSHLNQWNGSKVQSGQEECSGKTEVAEMWCVHAECQNNHLRCAHMLCILILICHSHTANNEKLCCV